MRHILILASPAILLLSSCEQSEDQAGARNTGRRDNKGVSQPGNTANRERIAAQDSVGRPPQPRNLATDVEDTCPVHHEKMKLREIPIVFEEAAFDRGEPASASVNAEYPFGAEKIFSVRNTLMPGEPLTARVYQCPSCIVARKVAEAKGPSPAASRTAQ